MTGWDFFLIPISKEDRKINIEREFAALNEILEEEQLRPKNKTFNWPVGRPRLESQIDLLKLKVEKMKPNIKPTKVRGPYTNWFTLTFWLIFYKAIKQHPNITEAWSFFRSIYRNYEMFLVSMTNYLRALCGNDFIQMQIWRRPINIVSIWYIFSQNCTTMPNLRI